MLSIELKVHILVDFVNETAHGCAHLACVIIQPACQFFCIQEKKVASGWSSHYERLKVWNWLKVKTLDQVKDLIIVCLHQTSLPHTRERHPRTILTLDNLALLLGLSFGAGGCLDSDLAYNVQSKHLINLIVVWNILHLNVHWSVHWQLSSRPWLQLSGQGQPSLEQHVFTTKF